MPAATVAPAAAAAAAAPAGRRHAPAAAAAPPVQRGSHRLLLFYCHRCAAVCVVRLAAARGAAPAAAAAAARRRRRRPPGGGGGGRPAAAAAAARRRRRRPPPPCNEAPTRVLYFALTAVVFVVCFGGPRGRYHGRRPAPAAAAAAAALAVAPALAAPAPAAPAPSFTSKSTPVPVRPAVRHFWRAAGGPGWLLLRGASVWRAWCHTTAGRSLEALDGCSLGGGCMSFLTRRPSVDSSFSLGSYFVVFEGCILLPAPLSACLTLFAMYSSPVASFFALCWRQLHDKQRNQLTCVCSETHPHSPLSTFHDLAKSVGSDAHGHNLSLSDGKCNRGEPG